jgi:hypothetical protein
MVVAVLRTWMPPWNEARAKECHHDSQTTPVVVAPNGVGERFRESAATNELSNPRPSLGE